MRHIYLVTRTIFSILYQMAQRNSDTALKKSKHFTQPTCKVIRDGLVAEIKSEDVVVGDSMMVEEGISIAADIPPEYFF